MSRRPSKYLVPAEAGGIPPAPVGDPLAWTEYARAGDLDIQFCPLCSSETPDFFFMWRPAGLEYWRCLKCFAQTYRSAGHHQRREAAG